ncbi:YhcH/YjgK/YiaL family protein [Pelosinus sp. sgz500959]|uniref:YhcH/YjgK/YiaL family protein n=1 Tax=Pelosinus sp. sgz500959 TaxID=3242472 RepID=UPI00366D0161
MFFGNVAATEGMEKKYPAAIVKAIEYFKSKQNEFLSMAIGVYPIEGEDIFAQVINTETKEKDQVRPEVHRKYIDVQFSVEGKEIIGFAPDLGNNEVTEDLADTKDVIYYDLQIKNEIDLIMEPGSFTVLFPEDVHRPGCEYGGCTTIRKVVIKVNTAIL